MLLGPHSVRRVGAEQWPIQGPVGWGAARTQGAEARTSLAVLQPTVWPASSSTF